jgi:hypothetical protein
LTVRSSNLSRTLAIVVGLVLLLNAAVSTANVIEDGALLRRVVPALCWILATVIWTAVHPGKAERKE